MSRFNRATLAGFLLAPLMGFLGSSARADTFAPGSMILPMDTTYQDLGMFRAYGLVYDLLRKGVPVRWVIAPGKQLGGVDFVATGTDLQTNAAVSAYGYRGGPFVIDEANAAAALPIIQAWQAANPNVKVHVATQQFTGTVAKRLLYAPNVAMFADGNQAVARTYLVAAGIPDSTLNASWPDTSPDMLSVTEVKGPTTTNHADGALFDADGDPVYCQFMSMHWGVNDAAANPEVVAEVREYLTHPVHFFAECQAVNAFENTAPHGFFLTPNGYQIAARPSAVTHSNHSSPFAQIDGAFGTVGGSEPAYKLPPGDAYKAGGVTMIRAQGTVEGQQDVWMTGYLDGACPPNAESCGSGVGKVSYLGGHKYEVKVPISQNPASQGTRLFLNSLFDSDCATASGAPDVVVTKTAPATTATPGVTFTINYVNTCDTTALQARLFDALPAGTTFVSASNGGVLQGGAVTWNLGNLGPSESGTVTVQLTLGSMGTYENVAELSFKAGLNPLESASNTTTTIYGADSDGDGVIDDVDTCPDQPNPLQSLQDDVANCGACGNACQIANGDAVCALGVCFVEVCDATHADCNFDSSDGCETAVASFEIDPANCGDCNVACVVAGGDGSCDQGTCFIGACDAGSEDCNGIYGDGCEYATAGFDADEQNCGGCGIPCGVGLVCVGGSCVVDTCASGTADCDALGGNGCEYLTDGFATDEQNCGGCGLVCDPASGTGACLGGECTIATCDAGSADCDGLPANGCETTSADLQTDEANCGGCGLVCDPTSAVGECLSGGCTVAQCDLGFADCNGDPDDGCEVDTDDFATDGANCGGCGAACAPASADGLCLSGECTIAACDAGSADCNGLAEDGCEYATSFLDTDESNCGGCGDLCDPANADGLCIGGMCVVGSCAPGFIDANGNPVDGCEAACTASGADDATCDAADDDCDGVVDDDYLPVLCGVGSCQAVSACVGGTEDCTPGSAGVEGPLLDPSCDDVIDNDCDGDLDDADADCQAAPCADADDCDDAEPCTIDACTAGVCDHVADPACDGTGGAGSGSGGGDSGGGDTGGGVTTGGEGAGSGAGGDGAGSTVSVGTSTSSGPTGSSSGAAGATSATTSSTAGGADDDDGSVASDEGCGCRTAPTPTRGDASWLFAAIAWLLVARRRGRDA